MKDKPLETLARWKMRSPRQQGYLLYMQAHWPGSELRDQRNPYVRHTPEHTAFVAGETAAVLEAQDSEE